MLKRKKKKNPHEWYAFFLIYMLWQFFSQAPIDKYLQFPQPNSIISLLELLLNNSLGLFLVALFISLDYSQKWNKQSFSTKSTSSRILYSESSRDRLRSISMENSPSSSTPSSRGSWEEISNEWQVDVLPPRLSPISQLCGSFRAVVLKLVLSGLNYHSREASDLWIAAQRSLSSEFESQSIAEDPRPPN